MQIYINVWFIFLNEKIMQNRVNILDSQSFKFVFGHGQIKVAHCPPKKIIQNFEMHHN